MVKVKALIFSLLSGTAVATHCVGPYSSPLMLSRQLGYLASLSDYRSQVMQLGQNVTCAKRQEMTL